jgi:hypothetical protein
MTGEELEEKLKASKHAELLGMFPDPCYRVAGHFVYPHRIENRQFGKLLMTRVAASTSPQYCNGAKPERMTYPVEDVLELARSGNFYLKR